MFLEPPHFPFRSAAELGRIEQDPVIAPAAAHLARGKLGGIVDDPADRARPPSTDFLDASTWTSRAPTSLSSNVPTPV